MGLDDIKYIERKYTQRQDYNSPQKRAMVRSPLDRHYYHYRYECVQNLLVTYTADRNRILDFGCGFGLNAQFISNQLNKTVYGLELDELKLSWARSEINGGNLSDKINLICGDVSRPPFAPGSFDCILFTEVLEHLIEPTTGLSACNRLLSKDGILIITVPSRHNLGYSNNPFFISEKIFSLVSDSVLPKFHNLHARFEYNWRKPEPEYGMHYNFTYQSLTRSLKQNGFSTLWYGSFEIEVYPFLIIEMLARGNVEMITKLVNPIEELLAKLPIFRLL